MSPDISHLDEIQQVLRECNFSPPKWYTLGLDLGLLKPTLDTIETQYRNDIQRCLLECISQWLKKADKTIKKGEPTWDSLASALRNIGEVTAAEKVLEIGKCVSMCRSNNVCLYLIRYVLVYKPAYFNREGAFCSSLSCTTCSQWKSSTNHSSQGGDSEVTHGRIHLKRDITGNEYIGRFSTLW